MTPYDAHYKNGSCSLSNAMNAMSSRWKPLIVCAMRERKNVRFGHLTAVLGVSKKVLTEQLRQLEQDGIVIRKEISDTQAHIEYKLTRKGMELVPILTQLEAWDKRHMLQVA